MKQLSRLFAALAVLLWGAMCAVVAWNYSTMLHGIEHHGYSAPASIAFFYAIPFVIGIAVCVVLAIVLHKKSK